MKKILVTILVGLAAEIVGEMVKKRIRSSMYRR